MKAIVCEMCNGHNLVKEGGLYVCQNCDTKYSLEEAKKLMVDISGSSVKIDASEQEANYRRLAMDAKASGNVQKAAEYYNKLVVLCPDDWEALFFSVYFTSANCIIAQMVTAANNVCNAIKLTYTKFADSSDAEKLDISSEMSKYVLLLAQSFLQTAKQQLYEFNTLQSATNSYHDRCAAIYQMIREMADVAALCGNKRCAIDLYEMVASYTDKIKIAQILESLEPGRGTKLIEPLLSAQKERLQQLNKDRKTGIIGFGVLGLVFLMICLVFQLSRIMLVLSLVVLGLSMLLASKASAKSRRDAKERMEQLEQEIENLKKLK